MVVNKTPMDIGAVPGYGAPHWSWTTLRIPSATSMGVEFGPSRAGGGWQATTLYIYPPAGKSTCSFVETTYQRVGASGYWKWGAYSTNSNTTGTPKSLIEHAFGDKYFPSWVSLRVAIFNNGTSAVGSGNPTNTFRVQYAWKEWRPEGV